MVGGNEPQVSLLILYIIGIICLGSAAHFLFVALTRPDRFGGDGYWGHRGGIVQGARVTSVIGGFLVIGGGAIYLVLGWLPGAFLAGAMSIGAASGFGAFYGIHRLAEKAAPRAAKEREIRRNSRDPYIL